MKSLLLFCISNKMSGGELYSLHLSASLQSSGWNVSILGNENSGLQESSEKLGIRYIDSEIGPKLGRRSALKTLRKWRTNRAHLMKVIEHEKPDVVMFQYKLEQMLWAGQKLVPAVAILEHGPIPNMISRVGFFRSKYQAALDSADLRFAASVPAALAISEWGHPSVVLRAGLDSTQRDHAVRIAPDVRRILEAKLPDCSRIGVYAGRLTQDKGILRAAEVISRMPNIGLAIAGSGPCRGALQALADRNANITMLGQIDNVTSHIAAADFGILLTSDSGEGRPLFVLECAALGIPVVASESSPAIDALAQELGKDAVWQVGVQDDASISEAIRHVRKFTPKILSWEAAAKSFTDATEIIA